MNAPSDVLRLISRLNEAGFSAYAVGGCVRDSLLGLNPHDWDLCTSARTDELQRVFAGERLIETGLRHGTVTVIVNHVPYEITTYRVDGAYTDHRHPDEVRFVSDLSEDLSRRDFTVNAMAWSPGTGLVDLFGGRQDLAAGLIRCVGDPAQRFGEDALRILRALRFASVYDFALEPETAAAVHALAPTLRSVAAERIQAELIRLLCGTGVGKILRAFPDVLARIIPQLAPMIGFDQKNHHHRFDLWEHTVRAVEEVPPEPVFRMTMLLHDTGKPGVQTFDDAGEAHYLGHQKLSAQIADQVMTDLRFDTASHDRVVLLVENHDIPLRNAAGEPDLSRRFLLRRLNRYGEKDLKALFLIHRADRIATGISSPERENARLTDRMQALDALLAEQPCFTLRELAVNGHDLMALGYSGKAVGTCLQMLLDRVIDGTLSNRKEDLLTAASEMV